MNCFTAWQLFLFATENTDCYLCKVFSYSQQMSTETKVCYQYMNMKYGQNWIVPEMEFKS